MIKQFLLILFLGCQSWLAFAASPDPDIEVSGWPLIAPRTAEPDFELGSDPVVGRMSCPPFSRYNPERGISESTIAKSITLSERAQKTTWEIDVRAGIFWWNGAAVQPNEVADFIRKHLSSAVQKRSGGLWKVPDISTEVAGTKVFVSFATPPNFGPYVFNGFPFWKPADKGNYQCVGLYSVSPTAQQLELLPNTGYEGIKPKIAFTEAPTPNSKKKQIRFQWSQELPVGLERNPFTAVPCRNLITSPFVSAILWNLEREPTQHAAVRQLLSSVLPRNHIRQTLCGGWANNNPKLTSFYDGLNEASTATTSLATGKSKAQQHFKGATPRLALFSPQPGAIERLAADVFTTIGFEVQWVNSPQEANGVFTGLRVPMYHPNLLASLHPNSQLKSLNLNKNEPMLALLNQFEQSTTFEKPNLALFHEFSKLLASEEPFTVIVQHQFCVNMGLQDKLKARDPDWFRKLVFGNG